MRLEIASGRAALAAPLGSRLPITEGDVHVWLGGLELPATFRHLRETLSDDERERAKQFGTERGRDRFIAARGILRMLVGRYLDADPRELVFRYGSQGKPELSEACGDETLRFNLSHSHDVALFAFARGCEVGVDVERVRALPDVEGLARRFLAKDDYEQVHRLPPAHRARAFFRIWTRLEACLKVGGGGLASLGSIHETGRHREARELPVGRRYAAAVALGSPIRELRFFDSKEAWRA